MWYYVMWSFKKETWLNIEEFLVSTSASVPLFKRLNKDEAGYLRNNSRYEFVRGSNTWLRVYMSIYVCMYSSGRYYGYVYVVSLI